MLIERKNTTRDPWIDNIKGILMVLVVVNHMLATLVKYSHTIEIIYKMIGSFHMPCFIILTGFLSKRRIDCREYGKMAVRLVIPYFVSQFLIWLFACVFPYGLSQISSQSTDKLYWLIPNYHLWYLFAIIIFSFLSPMLTSSFRKAPWALVILSFLCAIFVGYGPEILYMRVTKLIAYYPLFLFGYYFKKEWFYSLRDKIRLKMAGAGVLLIWAAIFIKYYKQFYLKIFPMATPYHLYPAEFSGYYPIMARGFLIVGGTLVSFAFMSLVTKRHTIFTHVGKNSLYVYILHGFFIIAMRSWDNNFTPIFKRVNTPEKKLLYILSGVALTFLLASPPVVKLFKNFFEPDIKLKKS